MAAADSIVVVVSGSFESALTPEKLERQLSAPSSWGFAEVEDSQGLKHLVNPDYVVEICEPGGSTT